MKSNRLTDNFKLDVNVYDDRNDFYVLKEKLEMYETDESMRSMRCSLLIGIERKRYSSNLKRKS